VPPVFNLRSVAPGDLPTPIGGRITGHSLLAGCYKPKYLRLFHYSTSREICQVRNWNPAKAGCSSSASPCALSINSTGRRTKRAAGAPSMTWVEPSGIETRPYLCPSQRSAAITTARRPHSGRQSAQIRANSPCLRDNTWRARYRRRQSPGWRLDSPRTST
jgi:hypothetical protein